MLYELRLSQYMVKQVINFVDYSHLRTEIRVHWLIDHQSTRHTPAGHGITCLCGTHTYPLISKSLVSANIVFLDLVFDMRLVCFVCSLIELVIRNRVQRWAISMFGSILEVDDILMLIRVRTLKTCIDQIQISGYLCDQCVFFQFHRIFGCTTPFTVHSSRPLSIESFERFYHRKPPWDVEVVHVWR